MYIYLSIYLSICLSVCLSVCLSFCLSIYLSIHPSIRPSIHPSIHMSIQLSIIIYMYIYIYIYIYYILYIYIYIIYIIYIYIYTIVNRNIKEPTGRIYGIYPRPQGSYTTAGKLYNHIKVRSRVQQRYMPYIIPGMMSCTCAVDVVTKSLQRMKAMSTSKHTKEALFVS